MQAAKIDAMDAKEDKAELEKVAAMDAVNEESKAAVADILAAKKAKEEEEEEEVEAADSPQPAKAQYTKKANVQINVEVEEAMKSLYAEGPIRHVLIRIDEKKKKKKRSYYAELASTGEDCLQPVIDGISTDL